MGKKGNEGKMKMPGIETGPVVSGQPWVPGDPLLAGVAARSSAALNSAQAQRGILGNLSACLNNPPSATL